MTTPEDSPQVVEGTDIKVEPGDIEPEHEPATTDPEEMTDGGELGGTGGQGGAG